MNIHTLNHKLIALLVFLMPAAVTGQNFKKDYAPVQEAYNKLDKFYCEIKINMYEEEGDKTPSSVMHSTIKKNGEDFCYSIGKTKMLMNDNCILYIDEDSKAMTYSARDKKNEIKIPGQDPSAMIDSIIKKSDSVVYAGIKDNCKRYIIYSAKAIISKTEITIDQANYMIPLITYHYDTKKGSDVSKVMIEYVKMNLSPDFLNTDFSEKKYAVYANKKLKPLAPYSTYKTTVIDPTDFK